MGTSSDEMWWRRSMLYNCWCASCILDKQVSTLRLHKETIFFQRSWELHRGKRELPPRWYNQIKQWQAWKLLPISLFHAYLLLVRAQFPGYSWLENDHDPWKVPTKSTRWGKVLMISKYDDDWYTDTRKKAATWVWSCGLKIVILAF
jgi:hypothetical protein